MKKKQYKANGIIAAAIAVLFTLSCSRNISEPVALLPQEALQSWVQQNGGNFASGELRISNGDGTRATGKLNWSLLAESSWKTAKVVKVPFVFEGNSSSRNDKILNEGAFAAGPVMASLYIKQEADGRIEALVKVSHYSDVEDVEKRRKESTVFTLQSKEERSMAVSGAANRFVVLEDGAATGTANRSATAGYDCETTVSYRKETSWVDGNCGPGCYGELVVKTIKRTHTRCTPTTGYVDEVVWWLECEDACGGGDPYEEYTEEEVPAAENDCAKAREMAKKLEDALKSPNVEQALEAFINNYKNANTEYGFGIKKTANGYEPMSVVPGTRTGVEFSFTTAEREALVAIVHTHPFTEASAVHSSTDIYGLNAYANSPNFAGNLVIHGDQRYLLSITDADQYNKFLAVSDASGFYDKSSPNGWKRKTKIYDDFNAFQYSYSSMPEYYGMDATLPTQVYLMQHFNLGKLNGQRMGKGMGVSFQKYESGKFNLQQTATYLKASTGSSSTIGGGGQAVTSRYDSITLKNPCKK